MLCDEVVLHTVPAPFCGTSRGISRLLFGSVVQDGPVTMGQPLDAPPTTAVFYILDFDDDPIGLEYPNWRNEVVTNVEH